MGQYKVPQDVEAEDKIIGPLTFKQFIYALIGFGWGLVCFGIFRTLPAVMIIVGFPPTLLFLLLAFYRRDGQNFEQLLIAMVGYFANSRRRLWVKEEITESFHIEPTKVVAEQTQRNPAEVRSELEKLATMIDSRGWNHPPEPATNMVAPTTMPEQRIVAPPPPSPQAQEEAAGKDIYDLHQSPLAANLAELLQEAAEDVREEAIQQMQQPLVRPRRGAATADQSISGVTAPATQDILNLATERDDLTVAQIAASAQRMAPMEPGQSVELRSNGTR